MTSETRYPRPALVEALSHAYSKKGKSVILLTGDTLDRFWCERVGEFIPLEQVLYQELSRKFTIVRVDTATGISFYDDRDDTELKRVCELADSTASQSEKLGDVKVLIGRSRHGPLPALVLLQNIADGFTRVRRVPDAKVKPLCAILQFAGALFPTGDYDRLSELDRQRLVTFLNWISSPELVQSLNLVILVSDTKSELNSRILALPSTQHIEIELPDARERAHFVEHFVGGRPGVTFQTGQEAFVEDTAGLRLTNLRDLLEVSARTREPVTRKTVLGEVNAVLEAELGDIIRVVMPEHGPADIIGHEATCAIFCSIFRRCEDPETAVSAVLVSGPNGGGKTFQLEAFAADSGRIVIELAGLRGMYFGQTDRFFEQLRWHIRTYGKILILVDEAHTAFGSVHGGETHPTEQRLAGNIIKMMGDPRFLGKVVWGLMTSRPDELDPDVKSRSPLQVPIFDLEGDERRTFVREIFRRKGITLDESELEIVVGQTEHYSARDYNFLVREAQAARKPVLEVLQNWQASTSIMLERRFQSLIAAQHCTYPQLLPRQIADMESDAIQKEIEELKWALHR